MRTSASALSAELLHEGTSNRYEYVLTHEKLVAVSVLIKFRSGLNGMKAGLSSCLHSGTWAYWQQTIILKYAKEREGPIPPQAPGSVIF